MLMPTSSVLERGKLWSASLVLYQLVCYSVVEYASHDDLKNAMKKLDGVELKGRKLRLIEDSKGSSKKKYTEIHVF